MTKAPPVTSSVTTTTTSSIVIAATSSSTLHLSPSLSVRSNLPEETTVTSTVTEEATAISTPLTLTAKETKTTGVENVTPGSKIAVSTKSIEQGACEYIF